MASMDDFILPQIKIEVGKVVYSKSCSQSSVDELNTSSARYSKSHSESPAAPRSLNGIHESTLQSSSTSPESPISPSPPIDCFFRKQQWKSLNNAIAGTWEKAKKFRVVENWRKEEAGPLYPKDAPGKNRSTPGREEKTRWARRAESCGSWTTVAGSCLEKSSLSKRRRTENEESDCMDEPLCCQFDCLSRDKRVIICWLCWLMFISRCWVHHPPILTHTIFVSIQITTKASALFSLYNVENRR